MSTYYIAIRGAPDFEWRLWCDGSGNPGGHSLHDAEMALRSNGEANTRVFRDTHTFFQGVTLKQFIDGEYREIDALGQPVAQADQTEPGEE